MSSLGTAGEGSRTARGAQRWATALLALALSACGTTTRTGQPTLPSQADSKDRVTQSDEPDSSRRARVRMELAAAYFGRGQMTTALDEIKLSIAADPRVAGAHNLRGLIYAALGDDKLAEESFRRAQQLDAKDADILQNFGWFLCQKTRYDEADAMFAQALAMPQYRESPRTLLTRGICQARAGNLLQAEGTLTRSYELDPASATTALTLAEVLYRRGDLERARFYIRRLNSQPSVANAQTLWLAARIENKLGNAQGTEDVGAQLRNRFPQSPETQKLEGGRFDE